jgi:uncharacterized protein (DUF1015 family)
VLDIQPFRGLRYNVERIGDLSAVISPPYDVISPEEKHLYYHKSPYNVVRLEIGGERPADSAQYNRYIRAADTLKAWLEEDILFLEDIPAVYISEHYFVHQGVERRRWGLTARVRLEDWGNHRIRPHESTLSDQILDRLNLLRSCNVNLSPISGMLRHEQGGLLSLLPKLTLNEPNLSVVDHYGVTHQMWIVTDEKSIAEISSLCTNQALYIIDGHHRYQTALTYQKEQQAIHHHYTGNEAFNFVMMTLVDAEDPGLLMLPTHRLVRLIETQYLAGMKEQLRDLFHLEDLNSAASSVAETLDFWLGILKERGKEGITIGLYGLDPQRLCLLAPREKEVLQGMMPVMHSHPWIDLDVSLLHGVILPRILGIDTPEKERGGLEYTRDGLEAIYRVDSGEYQLAFLLNPIPVSSILAVADAGDRLPQKSTYFYPKPPTGLVMYPL